MLNNQKMENHDEIASDETFEEIDKCSIKIEQQTDQDEEDTTVNYFDFNLEVNDLLETKDSKLRRSKRIKKLSNTEPQSKDSQVFMLQSYSSITAEQNLKSKYRSIRPEPYTTTNSYHIRSIDSKIRDITTVKKKNKNGNRTGIPNISVGTNWYKAKSSNKSIKCYSVELFFDRMAQIVLRLPEDIQAEVKMEICKLVTKAEIEYYESQER